MENKQKKTSVLKKYNDIVRSLHEEEQKKTIKKSTYSEIKRFLFKILIVFISSALTTLAFNLLLIPNGIYNSGLSGLLQAIFTTLTGKNEIFRIYYKSFIFGTSLLINLIIILILNFFKGKKNVLFTALFYSVFQLFWNWFFDWLQLNRFLFSGLSPENWQGTPEQSGFTLPFYIAIAIGAALIHTFGYSLIFQARATPGGLDIISSHLSSRKENKLSLKFLFKVFGLIIVISITLINFLFIRDNTKIKKADLKTFLIKKNSELPETEKFLQSNNPFEQSEKIDNALIKWEKENDQSSAFHSFLKAKIGFNRYPKDEYRWYLMTSQELIEHLKSKIYEVEKNNEKDKVEYLNYLKSKLKKTEGEECEKNLRGFLKFITNNESFWATMVYVFISSFFINQMFPKDIRVVLTIQTESRVKLDKILYLLKSYNPSYYITHPYEQKKFGEESTVFTINCFMSKWQYYLLQDSLISLEKNFFINEAG